MDLKVYADITKMDPDQRMVYGYASTEALDSQGECVTKAAVEAALPDYMRFANIREMHQTSAVGVAKEATIDDKGLYIAAKVVDDAAWKKVKEGVYKGFSIGGKKLEKVGGVVKAVRISEISLVDRPSNPETVFTMYKSEDEPAGVKKEGEMKKGMWTVSSLAQLLGSLNDLRQISEWETQAEGDSSPVPAKLKDAVNSLASILQEMVAEETKELTADTEAGTIAMAAKTEDLAKAGARNSKADSERIQKMHDLSMELGAACGTAKAVSSDDLLKLSVVKADELKKTLDDKEAELKKISGENDTLKKRVSELEALPVPPKAALKAIDKTEDTGEIKKAEEPKTAIDEIKKVHQDGGVPFMKFIGG